MKRKEVLKWHKIKACKKHKRLEIKMQDLESGLIDEKVTMKTAEVTMTVSMDAMTVENDSILEDDTLTKEGKDWTNFFWP